VNNQQQVWEALADFYAKGKADRANGLPCHSPYKFDTAPHNAWISGYYSYHKE
jgi:hypothetical protein